MLQEQVLSPQLTAMIGSHLGFWDLYIRISNLLLVYEDYNIKITFYVHISVLPNHLIWLSAVIFKINDTNLG